MKWFKDVRTDSNYDEAWVENFLNRFLDSEEGRQFVQLWRYERKRPKLKAILIGSLRSVGVIDDSCLKGVEECRFILDTLKTLGLKNEIQLDLTLARGLNYYTGAIFEVKALDVQIGSITGGGRYDNLTGIVYQLRRQGDSLLPACSSKDSCSWHPHGDFPRFIEDEEADVVRQCQADSICRSGW